MWRRYVWCAPTARWSPAAGDRNPELFGLVVGGYGLFGAIYSVTLRLARRRMLERVVDVITTADLLDELPQRISAGFRYGDFQFAIDPDSPDFLVRGVFSCYRPVDDDRPIPENQRALGPADWQALRENYACIVFNLHTPHTTEGVARTATTFRRLIDLAVERGGSYYLTYHRWADAEQILACYPQFPDFLTLKRHHDPDELFHSDWYQHHATLSPG